MIPQVTNGLSRVGFSSEIGIIGDGSSPLDGRIEPVFLNDAYIRFAVLSTRANKEKNGFAIRIPGAQRNVDFVARLTRQKSRSAMNSYEKRAASRFYPPPE